MQFTIFLDVDDNSVTVLSNNEVFSKYIPQSGVCDLYDVMKRYADELIQPDYYDSFMVCFDFDALKKAFNDKTSKKTVIYRKKDGEYKKLLLFWGHNNTTNKSGIYICIRELSGDISNELMRKSEHNIMELFLEDYYTIILVDLNSDTFSLLKSKERDRVFFSLYTSFSKMMYDYSRSFVETNYSDMVRFVYSNENMIDEFDSGRGRIDLVYKSLDGWVSDNARRMPDYGKNNRMILYATKSYEKERAQEENEEKLRLERSALQRIYDLLGDTYFTIQHVNIENRTIYIFKNLEDSPFENYIEVPSHRELYEYIEYNIYEEDREMIAKLYSEDNLSKMFGSMKETRSVEYRRYINNELRWISMRIQPVRIVNGKTTEVILATRNIDEQRLQFIKNQEENMKLLNEKKYMVEFMEAISDRYMDVYVLNYSTNSVCALNPDNMNEFDIFDSSVNYNVVFNEYVKKNVSREYRDKIICVTNADYIDSLLNDTNVCEFTYRKKNGDWITIYICKTSAYTYNNKEVLFIFSDSNEREGAKQRLEEALEEAEKANKSRTAFFANISHDIRTPMNSILGMVNIAKNNIDDKEKIIECIEQIYMSGKHLLQLINNVLDMTSIESGHLKLNKGNINLRSFIDNIEIILEPIAKFAGLTLYVNCKCIEHDNVIGDELRLRQILINILTNSLKYTKAGGTVSLVVEEKYNKVNKKSVFHFIIKDNGVGMSKEFLTKIYDPYERYTNDMTRSEGTGLGMSITKTFIELMNGNIYIDSEIGKGTTIYVDIPLEIVENNTQDNNTSVTNCDYDIAGMNVLVVEDHEINMYIMHNYLENVGINMKGVYNGEEAVKAIEMADDWEYDIVLMDIQMPVMNGYEATRRIRSIDREYAKVVPIYALSANAFDEDIRKAVVSGMDGHIAKPVQLEILYNVIRQVKLNKK